jgi:hypothetical protein
MNVRAVAASLVVAGVVLARHGDARACGASGPDGVSACSLDEHAAASRRWQAGVSGVYTSTALRFDGDRRADEQRGAVLASLAYRVAPRVTLQAAAGASLGGSLTLRGVEHVFDPGFAAALGASFRVLDAEGARPFVLLTAQLASSVTTTTRRATATRAEGGKSGYEAFDLRAGVLVGTTLWGAVSPYAAGRVFGGPAFWRDEGTAITGTDVSHYQVGAGVSARIGDRVSLFAEGIPLGERAVSGGASLLF